MNRRVETNYSSVPYGATAGQRVLSKALPRFHSQLARWTVITAALVLLALPFGTFANFPPTVVIWVTASILFLLAFYGFRVSQRRGENPWLAPLSLLMAFYFFKYGWGALAVYYWDLLPWEAVPGIGSTFLRYGEKAHLPTACHLILLGGVGLYLGAGGPMPAVARWLPALKWPIDHAKYSRNLVLYTPIALLVFVVLRPLMSVVIRDTVLLLGWIVWVILVIVSYRIFSPQTSGRAKWLMFLVLIFLAQLLLGLQTGMRANFLYPILLIVLGYVIARGRLPWKVLAAAIPLFMFVVGPWLTLYKLEGEVESISARISATSQQFAGTEFRAAFELGLDGLVGRFAGSGAGALSVFSQYYPDPYPFEMGRSFVLTLEQLVPRVLWPEKPNLSLELNRYTIAVGMLPNEDDIDYGVTSATFDAISEYYLNFGLIGVLLFAVLHGYFFRILYYWLVKRSNYEMGASLYIVFFFLNLDFFGVVQIFTSATRHLVVWPLILYGLSRKS
ncbi:MAG: O-antigen polysaccharide polymerase Wzy [candidate division NC10 bacterium]|nr:O-antigen polysaccharide polymerase Wzy [candidate division NC10 bacterium]MDE2320341.1 O-antigen polysaccharide polymerase Wzy [candidate division NC10 bacterium]